MARVNIPRTEYTVLREIANLPEQFFLELVAGLRALAPNLGQFDLALPLSKNVKSIALTELKSFLRTLLSLYRLADAKERLPEEMAGDIIEAVERDKPKDFPSEVIKKLHDRLRILLGVGGIVAMAAKAVDLMTEHERVFCGARIVSDIRPIFGGSAESISAAIVTHSLKISFHEGGEHKEFYVLLTLSELKNLRKVVERAEKKSNGMSSFIQKSGIQFLGEGE